MYVCMYVCMYRHHRILSYIPPSNRSNGSHINRQYISISPLLFFWLYFQKRIQNIHNDNIKTIIMMIIFLFLISLIYFLYIFYIFFLYFLYIFFVISAS